MRASVVLFIALIFAISCHAEIIHVNAEGTGGYATIQEGINAAVDGETVIAAIGTYTENIDFTGKNIKLTSTNPDDPGVVKSTIIQGDGTTSVVTFANGENTEAVITGFTITGGYGTVNSVISEDIYWGAGIYCNGTSPTIMQNFIQENYGPVDGQNLTGYGGGIACFQSNAIISRNKIRTPFRS